MREIDIDRIGVMTTQMDQIPSPLNPKSKFNGITRPVSTVLMMILRQAARDGIIPAAPTVSVPKQESVRPDAEHDKNEDVATLGQVDALYKATPDQYAITILLAAWCQLRRGECLGLQRRNTEWHPDGGATLHVRRQLNVNTGDFSEPKSEAGKRSLSVPRIMLEPLGKHLEDYVAPEAKAPVVPASTRGSVPLSHTRWRYIWDGAREEVENVARGFRFQDLRHTGWTICPQEGATLAELMRRGGHSDMRIVLRYQHATMTRDRELADRLSARVETALGAT